jgi:hypothetical protein
VAAPVATNATIVDGALTLGLATSTARVGRLLFEKAGGRQPLHDPTSQGGTMLGILAIAGTGYGLIGLLVIILLILLIVYFARRA